MSYIQVERWKKHIQTGLDSKKLVLSYTYSYKWLICVKFSCHFGNKIGNCKVCGQKSSPILNTFINSRIFCVWVIIIIYRKCKFSHKTVIDRDEEVIYRLVNLAGIKLLLLIRRRCGTYRKMPEKCLKPPKNRHKPPFNVSRR
mgnify:CR=1 FL=1